MIKEPSERDMGCLSELMTQLGYKTTADEFARRLNNIESHKDYMTLVAYEDDKAVGMVGLQHCLYYEWNGSYVRILALVVDENYREKGIATKLLEASEAWAWSLGARALTLNCGNRDERRRAHQFYQKLGFKSKSTGYTREVAGSQ